MKRTLVLSDVHLSQAHPEDPADPLWMRYRRRVHHPDAEFAALVDHLLAVTNAGDRIEIVFNGDLFDFDTPWVKDGTSSFDEHAPTDAGCTAHVRLILADHEPFFAAVAKVLGASSSNHVTFLSGNHDIELFWPGVRAAIRTELARLAEVSRWVAEGRIEERVRFRTWFHLTEDRIYFEHGSQYDIHNGVRHAAVPLTRDGTRIHPVLGKLAFRRTGARMGYFNPYYEETFYMGFFGYLGHFARFYARSHRHIVRTWFGGAMSTIGEIWRHRHDDDRVVAGRAVVRAELGEDISDDAIDRTHALRAKLAEGTMLPILRELWIDRVGLAALGVLFVTSVALALGLVPAAIGAAVYVVLFVLYEVVTPKPDVRTYDSAPPEVLQLFDIHRVGAICMGHTHRPFANFTPAGLYANSGAWCPAFEDQACTKPVLHGRPILWLATDSDGTRSGGLHWWRDGALVADAVYRRDGCS